MPSMRQGNEKYLRQILTDKSSAEAVRCFTTQYRAEIFSLTGRREHNRR
jgi:hypothetical protein